MNMSVKMVEIWRGDFLESYHTGHAVVCDRNGNIIESWGDPNHIILPRSSSKMLQALPLVESGAADAFGLTSEQLALSCASHQGALIHTGRVREWLSALNIDDSSFRCGAQSPSDKSAKTELILLDQKPCQYHNNCSGKHSGFLTLSRHLGAGPEYIDSAHPVQILAKEAFQSMTETSDLGYAIDGCSAPNFATTVHGLSRAMSKMANSKSSTVRGKAAVRLVDAMVKHPDLVAGEGRACTELMMAMEGKVAVKTGAEGVFIAILPEKGIGISLKITDGTTRAAESAITGLLVKYGALDSKHPIAQKHLNGPIVNWRGVITGGIKLSESFISV